jgi:hypothetical protein
MKHLLNNLSEEEKNSIREQHTDRIKIDTSKFKSLMESKLGDAKPLVEQQTTDKRPHDRMVRDCLIKDGFKVENTGGKYALSMYKETVDGNMKLQNLVSSQDDPTVFSVRQLVNNRPISSDRIVVTTLLNCDGIIKIANNPRNKI